MMVWCNLSDEMRKIRHFSDTYAQRAQEEQAHYYCCTFSHPTLRQSTFRILPSHHQSLATRAKE